MRTVKHSYGYKNPRKRTKKPEVEPVKGEGSPGVHPGPQRLLDKVCVACGYPESLGHDPECGWVRGDIGP